MNLVVLFVIACSIVTCAHASPIIDSNFYVGCYRLDYTNGEFSSYSGVVDISYMTPSLCVKACNSLGSPYAALKASYCFCGLSLPQKSVQRLNSTCSSDCQTFDLACPGDSSRCCGSSSFFLVYETLAPLQSIGLDIDKNKADIFDQLTVSVTSAPTSSYVTFMNDRWYDHALSTSKLAYSLSYIVTQTKTISLYAAVTPTGRESCDLAARKAITFSNVASPLNNLTLSCPSPKVKNRYYSCEATIYEGTDAKIKIDPQPGAANTFTPIDPQITFDGNPVPTTRYDYRPSLGGSDKFIIKDNRMKFPAKRSYTEIYIANTGSGSGAFTIYVVYDPSDIRKKPTFECNNSFSTINNVCKNEITFIPNKMYSFKIYKEYYYTTINLGYNRLNDLMTPPDFDIYQWYYIINFDGSAAPGYTETSGVPGLSNAYLFTSVSKSGGNINGEISAFTKDTQILMRTVGIQPTVISTFNSFSSDLTSFKVTMTNSENSLNDVEFGLNFLNGIDQVEITSNGYCTVNDISCWFSYNLSPSSGTSTSVWTFTGPNSFNYTTSLGAPPVMVSFPSLGAYTIQLRVTNGVTWKYATSVIYIIEAISGLKLKAGTGALSASYSDSVANFSLTMTTGYYYNCTIDFGDSSTTKLSTTSTLANTYVSHYYAFNTGNDAYQVDITCKNQLGSQNYTFIHYVQSKITGVTLTRNYSLVGSSFRIPFSVTSGYVRGTTLKIDNITDAGKTFSQNSLSGNSSIQSGAYSYVMNIQIIAWNHVSTYYFYGTYEVGEPIQGAQLVLRSQRITSSGILYTLIGDTAYFFVTMNSGSNVNIQVFFGDETVATIPSLTSFTMGPFTGYNFAHVYSLPGNYTCQVYLSNAFGSVTLSTVVILMSEVVDVKMNNPNQVFVIESDYALATFGGSFYGYTYSGSYGMVTMNPDTTSGTTYGPYMLHMNYATNQTEAGLSYKYKTPGYYTVNFFLQNPISSTTLSMNIQVIDSMTNFWIQAIPSSIVVSKTTYVYVYLTKGVNVTLNLVIGGVTVSTSLIPAVGSNMPYKIPYAITSNTVQTLNVQVTASDSVQTLTRYLTIEVQNPVSFQLTTSPSNLQTILGTYSTPQVSITVNATNGTNAYLICDYGDSTAIYGPVKMTTSVVTLSHNYAVNGSFSLNVTVYNEASIQTNIIPVYVMAAFDDMSCDLYWRPYSSDGTVEYMITPRSDGSYDVPKEYDVRFHCSWQNTNNVVQSYTFSYGDMTQTSSALGLVNSTTGSQTSYAFTLPSYMLYNGSDSGVVIFTVRNSVTSAVQYKTIHIYSSVKNLTASTTNPRFLPNQNVTYQITFESLGEPSCAAIDFMNLDTSTVTGSYSIGNWSSCAQLYPAYTFQQPYQINNNVLSFVLPTKGNGFYQASIDAGNAMYNVNLTFTVTVSDVDCKRPSLEIENRAPNFYTPLAVPRSQIIKISGVPTISCSVTLSTVQMWEGYVLDSQTGEVTSTYDLSSNPSVYYSQLVIQPNTLAYGLYKFVYVVSMNDPSVAMFKSQIETYINVVPTGIAVQALQGGTHYMQIGTSQTVTLNPVAYSYDYDSLLSMSSLSFSFYCETVDDGIENGYPGPSLYKKYDLVTLQSTSPLTWSSNSTCFSSASGYSFDSTVKNSNTLTINANALSYKSKRLYRFLVQTTYNSVVYSHIINIAPTQFYGVPSLTVSCKFSTLCKPISSYQLINPNTQLVVQGKCNSGCSDATSISYEFKVYKSFQFTTTDTVEKWIPCVITNLPAKSGACVINSTTIYGQYTSEFTLTRALLMSLSLTSKYKIEYLTTIESQTYGMVTGSAALVIGLNSVPKSGSCMATPLSGSAYLTRYTISCSGWVDSDGSIVKYEYYALYSNNPVKVVLGTNTNGTWSFTLEEGPLDNYFIINFVVNIVDNNGGITSYEVPNGVVSNPLDSTDFSTLFYEILNQVTSSSINNVFNALHYQYMPQTVTTYVSVLNRLATLELCTNRSVALANITANAKGKTTIGSNYTFNCQLIMGSLSMPLNLTRNNRSVIRDQITTLINNLSISDVFSIKSQLSMLSALTFERREITRNSANSILNQAIRLVLAFEPYANTESLEELQETANFFLNLVGNLASAVGFYVDTTDPSLEVDFANAIALPEYYDTDLQNFWTNPNNFNDNGEPTTQSKMDNKRNLLMQKYQFQDTSQKVKTNLFLMKSLITPRLAVGQSLSFKSLPLTSTISRLMSSDLPSVIHESYNDQVTIYLPSYCQIVNQASNCNSTIINVQTNSFTHAFAGFNSDNETFTGQSKSAALRFTDDNDNEIYISESNPPIKFQIPRDYLLADIGNDVHLFNISAIVILNNTQFVPNGINMTSANTSLTIELYPLNLETGYLILLKWGDTPHLNATYNDIDIWRMFCPSDLINIGNETHYNFFMNTSQTNGFTGFVGFGIRELNSTEYFEFCVNNMTKPSRIPMVANISFSSNFWLRAYSSGCYYYDYMSAKWASYGAASTSVLNRTFAYCQSSHLTEFAGGWNSYDISIDFTYIWANAPIVQNPTVYITIILITCLYILLSIWARWMDRRDVKRLGMTALADNSPHDHYLYEVITFTSSRRQAATDSKVNIIVSGFLGDSGVRRLDDHHRPPFRRGGVDSFVMAVHQPLGPLNCVKIWHDNSGKGSKASWYLKHVIVHDLQTREKFYFLCERWMAVEKDDGRCDRLLGVCGDKQKTEIAYLASRQIRNNINDRHLWLSIFTRPPQSSFTRVDRVFCSAFIVYSSMMITMIFYQLYEGQSSSYTVVGPFYFSSVQLQVATYTNLLLVIPGLLLIELFRRSKKRVSRFSRLQKTINEDVVKSEWYQRHRFENLTEPQDHKGSSLCSSKQQRFRLPWWCKIIGYVICAVFIITSIIVVLLLGIQFGNTRVQQWFTSFIISLVAYILLIYPIQVVIRILYYAALTRQYNEPFDLDDDDYDPDRYRPLNDDEEWLHVTNVNDVSMSVYAPFNPNEFDSDRAYRFDDLKSRAVIRELIAFLIFVILLFVVVYSNTNPSAYFYQKTLQNLVETGTDTSVPAFHDIKRVDDFWNWAINTMMPSIRASVWYNGSQPYGLAGFLDDFTSRMVGYAIFRQIRVKNNSCTVNPHFEGKVEYCDPDYSFETEDTTSYGYSWGAYNKSYSPKWGMVQIYNSFQYKTAESLDGSVKSGLYSSYGGGGYVYYLIGKEAFLKGNLTILQQLGWIDRQTRAVIIEFSVYNPNINLFLVGSMIIEFLPSGTIITTSRFDPLNLMSNSKVTFALNLTFLCLYMLVIMYFMYIEFKDFLRLKIDYFVQFWSLIELSIICLSWASFGFYIYRILFGNKVSTFFKQTAGYAYMNMEPVNAANQSLSSCLGICTAFGTLKFIKLMRFNKRIAYICSTLKVAMFRLVGFGAVFFVIFFAFSQLFYFLFYDTIKAHSSIQVSMQSLFEALLGVYNIAPLLAISPVIGIFFFSIFCIVCIFFMLNIFLTFITNSFQALRNNEELVNDDYKMIAFLKSKFNKARNLAPKGFLNSNPDLDTSHEYLSEIDYLPKRLDELVNRLEHMHANSLKAKKLQDQMPIYSEKLQRKIRENTSIRNEKRANKF